MKLYEIAPFIKNIHLKSKENWEQARLIAYIVAQVNSTKKMKVTDIIEFPWEKPESVKTGITSISNEDVIRLKQKALKYINNNE